MMMLRVLTGMVLMFLASACAPPAAPQNVSASPHTQSWCQEVHRQLNDYRREKSLPALQYHRGLEQLSLNHSEWLRQNRGKGRRNVSHKGSNNRARVAYSEYGMQAWGENVAYVSATPADVAGKLITMWKASPPHHKAMIGDWTHAGTGISVDEDGAIFATMNFGHKRVTPSP